MKKSLPLFYKEPGLELTAIKGVASPAEPDNSIIAAVVAYIACDVTGYEFAVHRYADRIHVIATADC